MANLIGSPYSTFGKNEVTAARDRVVAPIAPDWRANGGKR